MENNFLILYQYSDLPTTSLYGDNPGGVPPTSDEMDHGATTPETRRWEL